jgi:peptide subunit release factor 1 (eRF1)
MKNGCCRIALAGEKPSPEAVAHYLETLHSLDEPGKQVRGARSRRRFLRLVKERFRQHYDLYPPKRETE